MEGKILVLGGSSFLGVPILKRLIDHQDLKISSTYHQHKPELEGIKWIHYNAEEQEKLKTILEQEQPEVIINCIAISNVNVCEENPDKCKLINVNPTKIIVDYCKVNSEVKYVFLSTTLVYGNDKDENKEFHTKEDVLNPLNEYGRSKVESERLIEELNDYVIIRPCVVFGLPLDFQHKNIFNQIYDGLKTGEGFTAYTDVIRSPVYVEDVALLTEKIITQNAQRIFLAGGESTSIYNFALNIAQVFGFEENLIKPKERGTHPFRPNNDSIDTTRTEQVLNIKFKTLSESLEEIKKTIEEQGGR